MALTQGSPLPNITTTQGQTTTAPAWYTDYLSGLANTGNQAAQGAQYVGAQPLQNQAFNQVAQNVGNYQPALTAATNLANQAGGSNVAQMAGQFMNPYTQNVVNSLGEVGMRNIQNVLAPNATAGAVGSGQFGSKRGAEVLGQAINTGLSNLNAAQSQALQTGYTQSLQAAQNQVANQLAGSQQLGNLATQNQALGLGDVNALSTLGQQQQTIGQNESLFPLQVANQQAGLLRGYTVPTSVNSTYTGPIPGAYAASPLQQIAGIGSLLGALNQSGSGGTNSAMQNILNGLSKSMPDFSSLFGGSGNTTQANQDMANVNMGITDPTGGATTSGSLGNTVDDYGNALP